MNKQTAQTLGFTETRKLTPNEVMLLCSCITEMDKNGVSKELLNEALVNAVFEGNYKVIDFLKKWLKTDNPKSREKLLEDVLKLIEWNRTVIIEAKQLVADNKSIKDNVMLFKATLANEIRSNYSEGIAGMIRDLDLNKAAFYRFLSEDRAPNKAMLDLVKRIYKQLGITELRFIKKSPTDLP